jgi:hypothetical protein
VRTSPSLGFLRGGEAPANPRTGSPVVKRRRLASTVPLVEAHGALDDQYHVRDNTAPARRGLLSTPSPGWRSLGRRSENAAPL